MKHLCVVRTFLLLGVSLSTACGGFLTLTPNSSKQWQTLESSAGPMYMAGPAKDIVIDGVLGETAWSQSEVITDFAKQDGVPADASKWTKVRMVASDDTLYLSAELLKPNGVLVATVSGSDEKVWGDHCLEVLMQTPDNPETYKLIINGNAATWTGIDSNPRGWNPAIEVKTSQDANVWRLEASIPWRELGRDKKPKRPLAVQLKYGQPKGGGQSYWTAGEEPSEWGRVAFGRTREANAARVERFQFPTEMIPGNNVVSAEVKNDSKKSKQIEIAVCNTAGRKEAAKTVEIKPAESALIELPFSYDANGAADHVLLVTDQTDNSQLLNVQQRIRTVEALRVRLDRERIWHGDATLDGSVILAASGGKDTHVILELWDSTHRLGDVKSPAGTSTAWDFSINSRELPNGDYRLVVRTDGPMPREKIIHLTVGERMALPAKKSIPLTVNWPEGTAFTGPVPLYAGLSFPAGTLLDESQVRLLDETGNEVPLQTEKLSTWGPGGSLKWLALHFIGRKEGRYHAEFGSDVKRKTVTGASVKITDGAGAFLIDTGAARFEIPKQGPLLGKAWVGSTQILQGGVPVLLVSDQKGMQADETQGDKNEAPVIELAGPLVTIVKREGLLRTKEGNILGKYIVRLTFAAGAAFVPIQHTFVVTNDTNATQYSDISFHVAPQMPSPWNVAFDLSESALDGKTRNLLIDAVKGESAYVLQAVYPHHKLPEIVTETGIHRGGAWQTETLPAAAGEWMAAWNGNTGVALTMPNLAKLFPKELEAGPSGLTAHLWSSRGKRNLDYRAATIATYVGEKWVDKAYSGGVSALSKVYTNAESSARTHDLCLHLLADSQPEKQAEQVAWLAQNPPLALQDASWLHQTEAMGRVYPYSPEKFPRIESFLKEFFLKCYAGQVERFKDYGFLDMGAGPHTYRSDTIEPGDKFPLLQRRYSNHDYQMRTSIWLAYARSGDRAYFDYARDINRHINDFKFSHWDTPKKPFGGIISGYNSEESMLYWGGQIGRMAGIMGHQGFDLENFFHQYFLTGDRRAFDPVVPCGEWLERAFDPRVLPNVGSTANNFKPYSYASLLYGYTWDRKYARFLQECRDRLLDLDTTPGLVNQDYHGAFYKPDPRIMSAVHDYAVTGSQVAGEALTKYAEYIVKGEPTTDCGYQDHDASFLQVAYSRNKDSRLLDWMNTRLSRVAFAFTKADGELRGTPYEGTHASSIVNAVVYGLDLVAQGGDRLEPRPLFVFSALSPNLSVFFKKPDDQPVEFEIDSAGKTDIRILSLANSERENWRGGEARSGPIEISWYPRYFENGYPGLHSGYGVVRLPKEAVGGIYQMTNIENLIGTNAPHYVVSAPDGLWLDGALVNPPPYWIGVPANAAGEIYANKPARLKFGGRSIPLEAGKWTPVSGGDSAAVAAIEVEQGTFVQLRGGIPSLFSRSEDAWFQPDAKYLPAPSPALPDGTGFLLADGKKLEIPLGKEKSLGNYEFFDTEKGTLEFWIRPRWNANLQTTRRDALVFRTGGWQMNYIAMQPEQLVRSETSDLLLSSNRLITDIASAAKEEGQKLVNPVSLSENKWHHVALSWQTLPDEGWVSEVFVDGRPASDWNRGVGMSRFGARLNSKLDPSLWRPAPAGPSLDFSDGFDGWIDEIRLSDVPRYLEPFAAPVSRRLDADENTLLLLHFGKNREVIAPRSEQPPKIAQ